MLGGPAPKPEGNGDDAAEPSSSRSSPKPAADAAEPPKTKINITPAAGAGPSSAAAPPKTGSNPFAQMRLKKDSPAEAKTPSGTSLAARKRTAREIDDDCAAATPPARKQMPPQSTETDEEYANRVLSQVFRVTIDPHHMTSPQGHRLAFLAGLNEELNDANESLRLSTGILDQAIIEACTNWPADKPLMNYLLPCWKRAVKAAMTKTGSAARQEVHQEAKRLCMSNCLFALTMPDLFGYVYSCHISLSYWANC